MPNDIAEIQFNKKIKEKGCTAVNAFKAIG
jgi:hypothetical protein